MQIWSDPKGVPQEPLDWTSRLRGDNESKKNNSIFGGNDKLSGWVVPFQITIKRITLWLPRNIQWLLEIDW